MSDVVDELRHWRNQGVSAPLQLVSRAIDEIVALRAERDTTGRYVDRVKHLVAAARAKALEEAAEICNGGEHGTLCAARIRALKDKRDE